MTNTRNDLRSAAAKRIAAFFFAASIASALSSAIVAQSASDSTNQQHEAMKKLTFMTGQWSGPVSILRGPGEPLRLSQSENVQFKLGGLVLLIEGKSTGSDGKAQFEAPATVSFDVASQSYHIRAYHDGNYLDTTLTLLADGFSWGYISGPARIENVMHLTPKGEWQETTIVKVGENPARPSVEMLLEHKP